LSHADLTWFPTCIFMEFLLPRNYKWPQIFHEKDNFPKLTKWFENLQKDDVFAKVHDEVWSFWIEKEAAGMFDPVRELVETNKDYKWTYP